MTALAPATAPARHPIPWAAAALGALLTVAVLLEGRWPFALLMGLSALGAALAPLLRLPRTLVNALAVASVLNGASIAWDWYTAWSPFDEWAHLLNPVLLVAPSMIWLRRARFLDARPGSTAFIAASATYGLVLAQAWEVLESFVWVFPWSDTLSDVALGVLGAAIAGWWVGRLSAR